MMNPVSRDATLTLTRSFKAPRARVFQAWTNPDELKKWWQLGHGWKLNIVEVDLKVGGKFRIGLTSSSSDATHEVTGVFREVLPPERLVYTWTTNDSESKGDHSLVTVDFRDKGASTEVALRHERLAEKQTRQNTYDGWLIVLDGLARLMGG
jgi:uncharacterized protein YndB with AHSA1/START domain